MPRARPAACATLPFGPPTHTCAVHAHFHIYKSGGTAVNSLFRSQGIDDEHGWFVFSRNGLVRLQSFALAWSGLHGGAEAPSALSAHRQWYVEKQAGSLLDFVQGLEELRPTVQQAGCSLTSSTLLRHPIRHLASQVWPRSQSATKHVATNSHAYARARTRLSLDSVWMCARSIFMTGSIW